MPSYGERLAYGFELIQGCEYGLPRHERQADLATILRLDMMFPAYPPFDKELPDTGEQTGFGWDEPLPP